MLKIQKSKDEVDSVCVEICVKACKLKYCWLVVSLVCQISLEQIRNSQIFSHFSFTQTSTASYKLIFNASAFNYFSFLIVVEVEEIEEPADNIREREIVV